MITCVLGTWGIAVWYPSRVSGEQGKPALPDGPNYSLRLNFAMRKKLLLKTQTWCLKTCSAQKRGGICFQQDNLCQVCHQCPLHLNPAFNCMGLRVSKFGGCSQAAPLGPPLSVLQMQSGDPK